MIGLGTIINVVAVLIGGGVGLLLRGGIPERFQKILMQALGLSTMVIGLSGSLKEMFAIENGTITVQGSMLLILSLVIGGFLGELLKIEQGLDNLGEWIKAKVGAKNDAHFVEGFVSATLIICVGAMAIVGSLQDGLTGDYSTLLTKSILDCVLLIVMASTFGIGCLFAAIPVGLYQGGITLCAAFAASWMSDRLIANLSLVGSVLIFVVGCNVAFGKKFSPANLLPALLGPAVYEIVLHFM
ncbi:MAG: DUF554 domain-containing protein [Ruminococcaceae bacterium]|nr:DUF554 domain-containing protein [Oscillospiraceae bacterium]